jgi:hypothetical protein
VAWLKLVGFNESQGDLRATYQRMRARPLPAVYRPPHGGPPGIMLAHSLDPRGIEVVFGGMSSSLASGGALNWAQRELVNTVTSLTNQCFY